MMRTHFAILGMGLAGMLSAASAADIPLEDFFQSPAVAEPRLSDDGRRLVMLVPNANGRMAVAQIEVDTLRGGLVAVTSDYDVDFVTWKDDLIIFGGDRGGNESYALRSIRPDGTRWKDLNESYDRLRWLEGPVAANIISLLRSDQGSILTQGYGTRRNSEGAWEASGAYGYYRLNVRSGRRMLVEAIPEKVVASYADSVSGVCYGRLMQDGGDTVLALRAPGEKTFRTAKRFPGGEETWEMAGLTADRERALVIVQGEDRSVLMECNLRRPEEQRLAFVPEKGDVVGLIRSRRGVLWGVRCEAERPYHVWFDPQMGDLHASLQATFPGWIVELIDSSLEAERILFFVHSDRDPGAYYVWNQTTRKLGLVGRRLPKIDPVRMGVREPIAYAARDGLTIHGYLTRPPGHAAGPMPLILVPHGGPFGIRDSWEFDPEAQFLASRGYAVLQVNFRGSGGYGGAFQRAGKKEWGGKMQDDLTDAVRWAVERKITKEGEVAIMGASYGGYAALAGVAFTPELYRCGINYVGVSDLTFLAKSTRERGRGYKLFAASWIGKDDRYLHDHSPANFVDRICVPTLHAYGENDPRVDIQHWRVLEAALKRHGKVYEHIREADSGHGFQDEKARLGYYRAVEAFLAKNMPSSD